MQHMLTFTLLQIVILGPAVQSLTSSLRDQLVRTIEVLPYLQMNLKVGIG